MLANAQLFEGPEAVGVEITQGNEGSDERHESSNPFPLYDIRDSKGPFSFVCLCTTALVIRIFLNMYFWWKYSLGSVVDMLLVGSLRS